MTHSIVSQDDSLDAVCVMLQHDFFESASERGPHLHGGTRRHPLPHCSGDTPLPCEVISVVPGNNLPNCLRDTFSRMKAICTGGNRRSGNALSPGDTLSPWLRRPGDSLSPRHPLPRRHSLPRRHPLPKRHPLPPVEAISTRQSLQAALYSVVSTYHTLPRIAPNLSLVHSSIAQAFRLSPLYLAHSSIPQVSRLYPIFNLAFTHQLPPSALSALAATTCPIFAANTCPAPTFLSALCGPFSSFHTQIYRL